MLRASVKRVWRSSLVTPRSVTIHRVTDSNTHVECTIAEDAWSVRQSRSYSTRSSSSFRSSSRFSSYSNSYSNSHSNVLHGTPLSHSSVMDANQLLHLMNETLQQLLTFLPMSQAQSLWKKATKPLSVSELKGRFFSSKHNADNSSGSGSGAGGRGGNNSQHSSGSSRPPSTPPDNKKSEGVFKRLEKWRAKFKKSEHNSAAHAANTPHTQQKPLDNSTPSNQPSPSNTSASISSASNSTPLSSLQPAVSAPPASSTTNATAVGPTTPASTPSPTLSPTPQQQPTATVTPIATTTIATAASIPTAAPTLAVAATAATSTPAIPIPIKIVVAAPQGVPKVDYFPTPVATNPPTQASATTVPAAPIVPPVAPMPTPVTPIPPTLVQPTLAPAVSAVAASPPLSTPASTPIVSPIPHATSPLPSPSPAPPIVPNTTIANPTPVKVSTSAHVAPAFLRPVDPAAPAGAIPGVPVVNLHPTSTPAANTAATPATAVSSGAVSTIATPAGASSSTSTASASTAASSSNTSAVPQFLRPAPEPLLVRLQRWKYFKHWPNIGYIISAVGTLVSDILWLRSIIILSNLFGIAVNFSFKPPFMIGIRWNFFFIFANLVQIFRILMDRRDVELTEEEQALYDALFSEIFSRQEYKKLLNEAKWQDLPAGVTLMQQGEEITKVHLISKGRCIVQHDKLHPLTSEEVESRRKRGELNNLQTQMLNGQQVFVTLPSSSRSGDLSQVEEDSPPEAIAAPKQPSISRTIAASLLQGGISWMERFTRSPRRMDEVSGNTASLPGEKMEVTNVEGSPLAIGMENVTPTLQHIFSAHAVTDALATSNPAAATDAKPASLPDAVILPDTPHGSTATPIQAAAIDSHHLLNVHVEKEPNESKKIDATTAADTDNPASTTTVPQQAPAKREIFPAGVGLGEGFEMMHQETEDLDEGEDDESKLDPRARQEMIDKTRGQMEREMAANAKSTESVNVDSANVDSSASSVTAPITNEDVIRRWREERAERRAARLQELDRRRAAEAEEKEKKRLLSMSALERQFGHADKKKDEPNKETESAVSGDTSSSSIVALDPQAQQAAIDSGVMYERHTSTVGYIRASRLIGEMTMVSGGASSSSDHVVSPVSVTTQEATRILTWEKTALQRLFFRLPSLAVGWYAVVSTDLVNRLKQQRVMSHQNGYKSLLLGVLADGHVSENQKNVCSHYRDQYDISMEYHAQALGELGWSSKDWDRGSTQARWFESWFNKRKQQ